MTLTDNIAPFACSSFRDFTGSGFISNERRAPVLRTPSDPPVSSQGSVAWILDAIAPLGGRSRHQNLAGLHEIVLQAVRQVNPRVLAAVAPPGAGVAFESKTLLTLLTWCYTSQIYSSEDIEELMREDREFRLRCENEFPRCRTLRRFRRCNAPVIEQCMAEVLSRQEALAPDAGGWPYAPAVELQPFRREAARRVDIARFVDHMTEDD